MEKLNNFKREIFEWSVFGFVPLSSCLRSLQLPSSTSIWLFSTFVSLLPLPSKTCLKWTNQDHIKTLHTFNILYFLPSRAINSDTFQCRGRGVVSVVCAAWLKTSQRFPPLSLSFAVAEDDDFSSISIFIHHPTKGSRIDRVPRHDDDVDWRKLSIIVGAHHFTLHSHWFDARPDRRKGEGKNIAWIQRSKKGERERMTSQH